jgi:predicted choloylglycine hydrolase
MDVKAEEKYIVSELTALFKRLNSELSFITAVHTVRNMQDGAPA